MKKSNAASEMSLINMKFQKKTLIFAGLAVVLVSSVIVLFFFKEYNVYPEKILKIMSDKADLEVRNVLYREVGRDDTKWEIRAEKASYRKKENLALFDKMEVNLFLSDGKTIVMTGEKGQFDTSTKDMQINGNVGIISGGGAHFTTDSLHYSSGEKRLHTGAAVLMETPQMQIRGVGMSLSLKNSNVVILSKVHARIK